MDSKEVVIKYLSKTNGNKKNSIVELKMEIARLSNINTHQSFVIEEYNKQIIAYQNQFVILKKIKRKLKSLFLKKNNFINNNEDEDLKNDIEENVVGDEYIVDHLENRIVKNNKLNSAENSILIVVSEIRFCGGEIFPIKLANQLNKMGKNVSILSVDNRSVDSRVYKIIDEKINVMHVSNWDNTKDDFNMYLVENNVSSIFSFVWWADRFVANNLKNDNVFWGIYMCGCYENLMYSVDSDFDEIMIKVLERVDKMIYSADKNLKVFKENGIYEDFQEKTFKTPLAIDKQDIITSNFRSLHQISEDSFVFCLIARGIREKGWEESIKMTINLKNQGKDVVLVLGGDSEYVEELKNKYKEYDYIKFLGFVENVSQVISSSNVCLLPSTFVSESMPMIIVEYLAYNKPVITTDIGEIAWMIDVKGKSSGTLLNVNDMVIDINSFIEVAVKYIEDINFYNEQVINCKSSFEKFDIQSCANSFLEFVNKGDL